MAKVLLGVAFAQIRGSIGGTTFSQNSNGAYIRNRSEPVNPNTIAQQAARAVLTGQSSSWKNLTDAERLTWQTQAPNYPYVDSLGQVKQYTAPQLFMAVNQRLVNAGEAPLVTIGAPVSMPSLDSVAAAAAEGTPAFTVTVTIDGSATTPAGVFVNIYASAPMSAGRNFISRSKLRKIATVPDTTLTPYNILAAYTAIYGAGALIAGNKIAVRVEFVMGATGQLSSSMDTFVIVAA